MSRTTQDQGSQLQMELAAVMTGPVLGPADAGYRDAAAVWNGCIEASPAVIAQCRSTQDVVATVNFARDRGLLLAVRGGGHSLPGFSTCDGGVVLDLSGMRDVTVDPSASIARAQAGCTWHDLDAATAAHGLATTGGLVSTTGIGGLTLGGGIGWLMRKYGLSCDNLLGAELVTAAGETRRVSDGQDAELLWGLRGGGGNFGVVTEFEFHLHPVSEVVAGFALFPVERTTEVARFYRSYVEDLPDEFTTMLVAFTAPDEEFVPEEMRGDLCIAVAGCHCGSESAAESALAPLRALDPAADLFGAMPYPDLQSMFDADLPAGDRYYFKGGFLPALHDSVTGIVAEYMATRPSLRCEFDLHHMGGAVARVRAGDTAFPDRSSPFMYNVLAVWSDPAEDEAHRTWARAFAAALDRVGGDRGYVNFLSDAEGEATIRRLFGDERYGRLVELKRKYDPGNLFRLNQNIRTD